MNTFRMVLQYFVFWVGFMRVTGFLPPIISQKIIISELESLITRKAFTSSFFENLNNEIDIERAAFQFIPLHFTDFNGYIYVSIVLTFLYSQWYFYDESKYERFEKIERFTKEKRIIKNIIFVLVLVFMKDIQNAS